jgi:lipopolysaccharide transport system ATP-binding protein
MVHNKPKAIQVENLSKAYQLGDFGTGTISRDLERFWAKALGKEDPYLKIGEINDRTIKGKSDMVWSLKDINFEINQGDAVGIIGRNGAGKSTLLKILSRITSPTTGFIKIKGRIASLLEVGTGFHPELTGRENIFLNGAILGMRKKEITRKFDEIVEFAGVDRYIDTPVKRYSSGMYVRLAFAVAAHLESEILIVDEVLAVGDVEFQKKCLGKMSDISKGEGRTVLFVSHNMGSIEAFCKRILHLRNGFVIDDSYKVTELINKYLSENVQSGKMEWINENQAFENDYFTPMELSIRHTGNNLIPAENINRNQPVYLMLRGIVKSQNPLLQVGFAIYDDAGHLIFWSFHTDTMQDNLKTLNHGTLRVDLPLQLLNEGAYRIDLGIAIFQSYWICEPGVNSPSVSIRINGGYTNSAYWTSCFKMGK